MRTPGAGPLVWLTGVTVGTAVDSITAADSLSGRRGEHKSVWYGLFFLDKRVAVPVLPWAEGSSPTSGSVP